MTKSKSIKNTVLPVILNFDENNVIGEATLQLQNNGEVRAKIIFEPFNEIDTESVLFLALIKLNSVKKCTCSSNEFCIIEENGMGDMVNYCMKCKENRFL